MSFVFLNTGLCLQSGQFYASNEMQPFSKLTAAFHLRGKLTWKVPATPVLMNNQAGFSSLQTDTLDFQSFAQGHLLCQTEALDVLLPGLTGQPPLTELKEQDSATSGGTSHLTRSLLLLDRSNSVHNGRGNVTHLTVLARITQRTYTSVCAQAVHARAFVPAGMRIALVDLREAEGSCKPHRTLAGKGVDAVHTSTSIETGAAREREQKAS